MSALEQLIQNLTQNRKPSRKRSRDEMVYKEVYNITKCQNTKMRSTYSNVASSSSEATSTKREAKS